MERSLGFISDWFRQNEFQLNAEKCKLIILGKPRESPFSLFLNCQCLTKCEDVKLLGINIDNGLTFYNHGNTLCRKTNVKIAALRRITN